MKEIRCFLFFSVRLLNYCSYFSFRRPFFSFSSTWCKTCTASAHKIIILLSQYLTVWQRCALSSSVFINMAEAAATLGDSLQDIYSVVRPRTKAASNTAPQQHERLGEHKNPVSLLCVTDTSVGNQYTNQAFVRNLESNGGQLANVREKVITPAPAIVIVGPDDSCSNVKFNNDEQLIPSCPSLHGDMVTLQLPEHRADRTDAESGTVTGTGSQDGEANARFQAAAQQSTTSNDSLGIGNDIGYLGNEKESARQQDQQSYCRLRDSNNAVWLSTPDGRYLGDSSNNDPFLYLHEAGVVTVME
jgi:hypothetical protein